MKTSRQRVLEYIRSRKVIGVAELSRALRMTPANARHHLSILQEQGLVQVVGQVRPEGKGRPARLYSLSERVQSNNLDRLASAVLSELLAGLEPPEVEQMIGRLALRLIVEPEPGERKALAIERPGARPAGRSLTQAILHSVQRLNELHYQARWEAHAESPRLILGHCPYATIIADHPELCQMDARLLELMLDRKVSQSARLAPDPQGGTFCLFVLDKP
jgi:DeoR family transcriptional regulator, suf operon transcriptional repressor